MTTMNRAMKPFTALVSAEDALELMLSKSRPVTGVETVALEDADGRVVAEEIKSTINVPAFDRAAMDGYAVNSLDLEEPGLLKEAGGAYAGSPYGKALKRGECVEIATGAPIPKGADAVVMVEQSTKVGSAVSFTQPIQPGENIGLKAADIAKGDTVVARGMRLTPGTIAAVAIVGKAKVKVFKRPEVLVFTTGDEVQAPGVRLGAGQVYDSNSFAMMAIAKRAGANVTYRPNVQDSHASLKRAIAASAKKYDLIVFSGGTSVGSRDFARDVLDELGRVHVHGIAIKPGKPVLYANVENCGVFGMPGNPTSCLLTARLFLAPTIRKLAHWDEEEAPGLPVTLGHEVKQDKTKQLLVPVALDEQVVAVSTFKSSSSITSLSASVGYLEIEPGDGVIPKGTEMPMRVI